MYFVSELIPQNIGKKNRRRGGIVIELMLFIIFSTFRSPSYFTQALKIYFFFSSPFHNTVDWLVFHNIGGWRLMLMLISKSMIISFSRDRLLDIGGGKTYWNCSDENFEEIYADFWSHKVGDINQKIDTDNLRLNKNWKLDVSALWKENFSWLFFMQSLVNKAVAAMMWFFDTLKRLQALRWNFFGLRSMMENPSFILCSDINVYLAICFMQKGSNGCARVARDVDKWFLSSAYFSWSRKRELDT